MDQIMVREIPPRLKGKIARRVETEGTNMKDVLIGILAGHYDVPFEPSGARRSKIGSSPRVLLDVSDELGQQIRADAAARGEHISNVAKEIISEHFGVPYRPTGARARTRRTRRAPAKA